MIWAFVIVYAVGLALGGGMVYLHYHKAFKDTYNGMLALYIEKEHLKSKVKMLEHVLNEEENHA